MTAALASAKADIKFDHPKAEAKAQARSSVEINDSCNCFKFCLPCFGKKKIRKDSRAMQADRRTQDAAQAVLSGDPFSPRGGGFDFVTLEHAPETPKSTDRILRSHGIENLSQPHVTVDVHIDTGSQ